MKDLPGAQLWMNGLERRMRLLRDPENPVEPERKFQELVNMAQGFLSLSKSLLELARTANKAANSMIEPSRQANGNEQRGPDS